MFIGVVKGDALSNVILAVNKFAAPNPGSPGRVMRLQGQLGIANPIGDLDHVGEVTAEVFVFPTATGGSNPQPPGRGEPRPIVAESRPQLRGALITVPDFGGPVSTIGQHA